MNGRKQTQELHLSNAKALFNLDVGDELFEIVRRAGRLRAFADLNGERSERGWVHWMVFGGSFLFIPSAYFVLIVAPSVWISAHPLSTHLVMIVDADAVSQRLRGSSACCVRALPGTFAPGGIRSTRRGCWKSLQYRFGVFSGFHDSLFLTLVKSDRWHPQGYHLGQNDYSFDALETNCFGINIKTVMTVIFPGGEFLELI